MSRRHEQPWGNGWWAFLPKLNKACCPTVVFHLPICQGTSRRLTWQENRVISLYDEYHSLQILAQAHWAGFLVNESFYFWQKGQPKLSSNKFGICKYWPFYNMNNYSFRKHCQVEWRLQVNTTVLKVKSSVKYSFVPDHCIKHLMSTKRSL